MSRRVYTPEEKANILARLQLNGYDIIATAQQLDVPERTLYTWRRRLQAENQRRQSVSPPSPNPLPDFETDLQALGYLRKKIMKELMSLGESLEGSSTYTSPAQRLSLISGLLDRLMKLDTHLQPYDPPERIVFAWDMGLYIRNADGYRGPFRAADIPANWKQKYGPDAQMEIYWGDDTYSIIPDGYFIDVLMQRYSFKDDPAELVDYDVDDEGYEVSYGRLWG